MENKTPSKAATTTTTTTTPPAKPAKKLFVIGRFRDEGGNALKVCQRMRKQGVLVYVTHKAKGATREARGMGQLLATQAAAQAHAEKLVADLTKSGWQHARVAGVVPADFTDLPKPTKKGK